MYALVRQKVWEPATASDRGIDLWIALARAGKEEIVPVETFCSGGLVWNGPFASRALDALAIGVAESRFSDALEPSTKETVLEAAYSFWASGWLNVMVDLEYVVRPGGTGAIDNALIPGILLYVTF